MPRKPSPRGKVKNYSVQLNDHELARLDEIIARINAESRFPCSRNAWLRHTVLDAINAQNPKGAAQEPASA